jgi:prolyl 4-hydroxylase
MERHQILIPCRERPYLDGDSLDHSAPLAWSIPGVLTPAECAAYIAQINAAGPTAAPVTTPRGAVMRPDIRNNERVVIDDDAIAAMLYDRARSAIPSVLFGMRVCGANERLRCYRYRPGQRFAPHFDGAFVRNSNQRSQLTLIVYLNDDFAGGATAFHHYDVAAVPRTGTALMFQHHLLHEGCAVTAGTKYVMRSDVMYEDATPR